MITHLALVMDGNRRWAKQRGFFPSEGHQAGVKALQRAVDFCRANNIPYVSFYTFSLENFKRSEEERNFLFGLLAQELERNLPIFLEQGARIRFIGDRAQFPAVVRPTCERVELATSHLSQININFLFCYGAKQEIVAGVRAVMTALQEGRIQAHDVQEELFSQMLWTKDIPDPDLIIRTGGARRLSNFLLYQAAYSEIDFIDCLWPDITEQHLCDALQRFERAQRNFGT